MQCITSHHLGSPSDSLKSYPTLRNYHAGICQPCAPFSCILLHSPLSWLAQICTLLKQKTPPARERVPLLWAPHGMTNTTSNSAQHKLTCDPKATSRPDLEGDMSVQPQAAAQEAALDQKPSSRAAVSPCGGTGYLLILLLLVWHLGRSELPAAHHPKP